MKRLIVAVSGASGAIYGIRLLETLSKEKVETHLILSNWAHVTIKTETDYTVDEIKKKANYSYDEEDLSSSISSGSFVFQGMVIIPCSMTASAITMPCRILVLQGR